MRNYSGRIQKPVFFIVLVFLGAAIFASGCTHIKTTKDTPVLVSLTIPGPESTSVQSPAHDTVTSSHDHRLSAASYDYEAGMQQMPEVSTGVMAQNEIARYRLLLGKLNASDPGAARWVAGMGLFAEDRKISDDEAAFVEAVAKKDDPLRILVTPWVRDGIGSPEAGWAADASYQTGQYGYLTDDLQEIESVRGAVDLATKEKLKSIVKASETDYELRKGLCIIDEYGVPKKDGFNHQVPGYNTQLGVLLDLMKNSDIPPGYYRLALAAGIDYGAVETIGDSSIKANLTGYVRDTVAFTMETDRMIKEKGARWQARDYPLEANIELLWGAAGTMRPYPYSRVKSGNPDTSPWNHPSWESDFRNHPMGTQDFEWSFVNIRTLREMRDVMLEKDLPDTLATYSKEGYRGRYNDFEDARNYSRRTVNYSSESPVFLRDKTNVNMDWENFKKTGLFDSACYSGDLFAHGIDENACYDKPLDEKTLARSVNIAGFPGAAIKNREDGIHINTFTHLPVLLTFDQNDGKIKAFPEDKRAVEKYNEAISHHTHTSSVPKKLVLENIYVAIIQVPWDNFSDKELFSRIYMDGTTPLDYQQTAKGGYIPITDAIRTLPAGYLFRNHVAAVIDYEKA